MVQTWTSSSSFFFFFIIFYFFIFFEQQTWTSNQVEDLYAHNRQEVSSLATHVRKTKELNHAIYIWKVVDVEGSTMTMNIIEFYCLCARSKLWQSIPTNSTPCIYQSKQHLQVHQHPPWCTNKCFVLCLLFEQE